ncbi:LLM class flavin-dependent oxidoreductase [bacterium]|nr:LLM class flavin-dependent oxidoreductase [bacterium]
MRFAVNLAPFGEASDPRMIARLAAEAEAAGWHGFFVWDHLNWDRWGPAIGDPWICLAAAALATQSIRLGTMVTPVFRRRPAKLARETTSLQQLCQGRLILGVGLGAPDPEESLYLGEEGRLDVRARMTNEALALLQRLWSGKPVAHRGEFYKIKTPGFQPVPPAPIPVWIGATHPFKAGPLARAAQYQGIVPACYDEEPLAPEVLRALAQQLPDRDIVYGAYSGQDGGRDRERVCAYREAGVTWWLEPLNPWRGSFEELRQRLRQGPP